MGHLFFVVGAAALLSLLPASEQAVKTAKKGFTLEYAWKTFDWVFPNETAHAAAVKSGELNTSSLFGLDVDVWEKGGKRKVFVTTPNFPFFSGAPATLSTVSNQVGSDGALAPLLEPYPNFSWHRTNSCDSINSVFRIAIDRLDRLWVLDVGSANCPSKLLAFDLNTDKLLSKAVLSKDVLKLGKESVLVSLEVDVRPIKKGGTNTFVYMADRADSIVVYDHQTKSSWRVTHDMFKFEEGATSFNIQGSNATFRDGVLALALSPLKCNRKGHCSDRTLYFHSLTAVYEHYVKTSVLRNKKNFPGNTQNRKRAAFKTVSGKRPSQSAAEAMSAEGVIFSGLMTETAISCWNTRKHPTQLNIDVVARDPTHLQYVNGVKVRNQRVWLFSNRMHLKNGPSWRPNEVNYRVLSAPVADLIRGTKCAA